MPSCLYCGVETFDLRLSCCFDCATQGEIRLAKRTVIQHLAHSFENFKKRNWWRVKTDILLAFERLTKTGDYKKNGYFDSQNIDWRG